MKRSITIVLGTALFASLFALNTSAENLPSGQVDFGAFTPPGGGGQFVEVNLTSSLISMAARFVEKQEPDLGQLLGGLQLVHVNVIGLDDENRGELEKRTDKIRKELDSKGWERIVMARQEQQNVSVYLKTHNKDTVEGLVVMAMDGEKHAVFVNIVGNIKPEQLSLLGDRLHIDPLKKIGKMTEKIGDKAEEK